MSWFHSEQLPERVEELLACVAKLNNTSSVSQEARLWLSKLGEEKAVDALRRIKRRISGNPIPIQDLNPYIIVVVKNKLKEEKSSSPSVSNSISEISLDTPSSESTPLRRCLLTDTAEDSLPGLTV
eukprot:TRINITY_DN2264_c0_g2_i2.p1 TRINITY_DN2264_c0_g2~~TRINITY_DN2264_c0_g2_i2.p1  ORF type:complete len:148 (-),score=22.55 TRINITY_DN2264_c0_g2_i2:8-385(-)